MQKDTALVFYVCTFVAFFAIGWTIGSVIL